MLKVGMIDHHLNNFHSDTFLRLLRGPLADEQVDVTIAWESDPTGDDWCARSNVRRADSIEEVAREADALMIMAPDNVDEHLRLARVALPFGKPTVVDKFLAPTLAEAREIVALARAHSTPIMSSSALRYAVELDAALAEIGRQPVTEMIATGLSTWRLYACHTLAMVLRTMGAGVQRIIDTGTPTAHTVTLDYGGGRRSVVDVRTADNEWDLFGWTFAARAGSRYYGSKITDYDGFYANLMRHVAPFLKTGTTDMPIEEALALVAILEAAERSQAAGGEWVALQ